MHSTRRQPLRQADHRQRTPGDDGVRQPHAGALDSGACVSLSPKRITYALGLVILVLTLAHVMLMALYAAYPPLEEPGLNPLRFLSTLFDLNGEANPPSWYSSFLLLVASGFLSLIAFDKARKHDWYARHWTVLTMLFLYLSLDEGSRLHDRTVVPLRSALQLSGLLYYSWVMLAIPALLLFGVWYLRFFFLLPRRSQLLFSLAAVTYISGALGVEIITGFYEQMRGGVDRTDLLYELLVAIEECAEMVGVLIFIHALMSYIRTHVGGVHLRVGDGDGR